MDRHWRRSVPLDGMGSGGLPFERLVDTVAMAVGEGLDDSVDDSASCMVISAQRLGSWRIQNCGQVVQLHESDVCVWIVEFGEKVRDALHG